MPKKSRGFELFFRVLKLPYHSESRDLLKPALFISSPVPWTIAVCKVKTLNSNF